MYSIVRHSIVKYSIVYGIVCHRIVEPDFSTEERQEDSAVVYCGNNKTYCHVSTATAESSEKRETKTQKML